MRKKLSAEVLYAAEAKVKPTGNRLQYVSLMVTTKKKHVVGKQ